VFIWGRRISTISILITGLIVCTCRPTNIPLANRRILTVLCAIRSWGDDSLDNLVSITQTSARRLSNHYNSFSARRRSMARPRPGLQFWGRPINAMHKLSAKTLPQGLHLRMVGNFAGRIGFGIDHAYSFLGLGKHWSFIDAFRRKYERLRAAFYHFGWPCPWRCWERSRHNGCAGSRTMFYCQVGLVMLVGLHQERDSDRGNLPAVAATRHDDSGGGG